MRRAHVHLLFMIFRLTLITVKIKFWTFTAASQFLRQHILTLLVKEDWRKLSLPYRRYTFTLSNKGFSYLCHGTWQQLSENYQGDIPFLLKWNANLSKLLFDHVMTGLWAWAEWLAWNFERIGLVSRWLGQALLTNVNARQLPNSHRGSFWTSCKESCLVIKKNTKFTSP